jgi:HSP20 family protein
VYTKGNNVIVEAMIPDFNEKNIDISITDNVLTLKGKTEKKTEVDEKNYYRKEIKSGSFTRSVLLPGVVDDAKASAEYIDGMLTITVPSKKSEKKKASTVKVSVKKTDSKKK